jgi:hypothetical protein
MNPIVSEKISVTTTGVAGSASGESTSYSFTGKIIAVTLYPHASLPSTTDTSVYIVKDGNKDVNVETVAVFTNSGNTEGIRKRYPRKEMDDGQGNSLNLFEEFITTNGVHIEVSQADALTAAVVVEVTFQQG